jgi:glutamyl-tRNA synthetase
VTSMPSGTGRFAPSPSGDLHLGNLRTALVAWLLARSQGHRFVMRVDDLDPVAAKSGVAERQLADLAAIGLDWDGEPIWQSQRHRAHDDALRRLIDDGRTYECFCSRAEIQHAAQAPHAPPGSYPGTCRNLTAAERASRAHRLGPGRQPALRVRADRTEGTFIDSVHGEVTADIDDFVLRRTDGVIAYNLAVVVDDEAQGVTLICRGDDLLSSTPRQRYLAELLGYRLADYAHVPLVLNAAGARLAKRDGAVTLSDRQAMGESPSMVLSVLARSLNLIDGTATVQSPADLVDGFDLARIGRTPWTWPVG